MSAPQEPDRSFWPWTYARTTTGRPRDVRLENLLFKLRSRPPLQESPKKSLSGSSGPRVQECSKQSRKSLKKSASPEPHPSKPHPYNMPQAKMKVALQFSECCAAEVALQHSPFCSAEIVFTKICAAANENCTATSKKLRCRKVALSCRFPAGFKPPRFGTHV